MRWLRWEPNIWAGQTTELLQGTALWKYFHGPRSKCWSLSDVRLVPDTNHSLVYECSRRMLQSASMVLLKAFVRTDYKDLQNHKWKKPPGLHCRKDSWWKPHIWGEMKNEGKHEEWIWSAAHCKVPCLWGEVAPSWQRGKSEYLTGMGENWMGIRTMQFSVADWSESCTCLSPEYRA